MTYFAGISHRSLTAFDTVIPQDFDGLWGCPYVDGREVKKFYRTTKDYSTLE